MIATRPSTPFLASLAGKRGRLGGCPLALLVLGTLLSNSTPSFAGDEGEARMYFKRAETAYKLGRFEEAAREYEAAYAAFPAPAFLFNIAQAYRQQYQVDKRVSRLHKALVLYKSYLRESKNPPNRATVSKLIDEIKALLAAVEKHVEAHKPGTLTLRASGAAQGAAAQIDGQPVGVLPLEREIVPGGHFVQVAKSGYTPWSAAISVAPGTAIALDVVLQESASSEARPFYRKWWFWTAISAVVIAGTSTAIYFGARDSGGGPALPEIDLR